MSTFKLGLLTVVVSSLALAAAAEPAHAEVWQCLYKGKWVTTKTKNSDTMDWLLQWESQKDGMWKVIGDYNDKYGHAWFDGLCDEHKHICAFEQWYKEGKLAGKKYYFAGKYHDKMLAKDKTENTFVGTWGYSPEHPDDGGTWESTAICKLK